MYDVIFHIPHISTIHLRAKNFLSTLIIQNLWFEWNWRSLSGIKTRKYMVKIRIVSHKIERTHKIYSKVNHWNASKQALRNESFLNTWKVLAREENIIDVKSYFTPELMRKKLIFISIMSCTLIYSSETWGKR